MALNRAAYNLAKKALPTTIAIAATTLSNTTAFSFVGRYSDETSQAAHGFGYSIGNVLCLMIGFGLIGGMDSLCPQAIGRKEGWKCWIYLKQALILIITVLIIVAPLLWFSKSLIYLQDQIFADYVQSYLRAALPGFAMLCGFEALRKFLIYNNKIKVQNYISLLSILIQLISLELFVKQLQLGAIGAGYARSLTATLSTLILIIYLFIARNQFGWNIYCGKDDNNNNTSSSSSNSISNNKPFRTTATLSAAGTSATSAASTASAASIAGIYYSEKSDRCSNNTYQETYPIPITINIEPTPATAIPEPTPRITLSIDQDNDDSHLLSYKKFASISDGITPDYTQVETIGNFFRMALPAALMCAAEWLSYEAMVLEAAALGPAELAALSTSQALGSLCFCASSALALQVTNEVGRAIGRGNVKEAKTYAKAGFLCALILPCFYAITMLSYRSGISAIFSNSQNVQRVFKRNLPLLAMLVAVDCCHIVGCGILKATNSAWYGAVFDLIGLLGFMQISGLYFAFIGNLGSAGFILGGIIGVGFATLAGIYWMTFKIEWGTTNKPYEEYSGVFK